ncbi:NAD-dependent epimerase/dehydratase family protein [Pseudomonas gingeri]|uniref:NAD-dependent epimerase/dehydratase family protein n=1 Tax=Pseudomonas gingeri TaxID=117681 RepID=UPI00159FF1D6|nr:NAD-dependent epimerase/dehydratase family protein [Pseudomonas gingeri]NVZ61196.1 NAD-dependent epimerase/dehydratase family protein [Pseudomonas gingeri]NVZ73749.1 NAD-dependent epimerase/dehydratase family protein [Pseudomonas gingeri]
MKLACVTGGSGLIGRHLVPMLLAAGYGVRALVRTLPAAPTPGVEYFLGDITNAATLAPFLDSANVVFHSAAELHQESSMWAVNVTGTENLVLASKAAAVEHFCFFSSAGVVGLSSKTCVSEDSDCSPRNAYERSKLAAEKIVLASWAPGKLIILRPTNVVDDTRSDVMFQAHRGSISDWLKFFFKGGECAHLVHAADVAAASLYLITKGNISYGACFFVSCDQDENNYFSRLWSMARRRDSSGKKSWLPHLPIIVPYIIRALFGRRANKGNVKYSSERLASAGFIYTYTVEKMMLAFCERIER